MELELTAKQLSELTGALKSLRQQLTELLSSSAQSVQTVELDQPIGRLTRMDAIQQQQMAQAGRRSQELRLKQVNAALISLTRDEYGDCRTCEEPIGYGRLKARPETPYCLACQGRNEKTG